MFSNEGSIVTSNLTDRYSLHFDSDFGGILDVNYRSSVWPGNWFQLREYDQRRIEFSEEQHVWWCQEENKLIARYTL